MSWTDREYNQGGSGGRAMHPLLALLFGSAPLGKWFGIRVKVHASLIIFILLTLLLGSGASKNFSFVDALTSMGLLFGIVLLHEFGHCFASRLVGGEADEIILSPLGGLAFARAPHRPGATFLTVLGGPLVNVLICAISAGYLWYAAGMAVPLNPFDLLPPTAFYYTTGAFYAWWVFKISYLLLLFNLLPIFPLDGGQMLQAALWPSMGYYRSLSFSCTTGMIGATAMVIFALVMSNLLLASVAVCGFIYCYQRRAMIREIGSEGLEEAMALAAAAPPAEPRKRRRCHLSRRAIRRIRRRALREQQEQAHIDAILDKVSSRGLGSLSWSERRALRKATERQRQRDLELTRSSRDD